MNNAKIRFGVENKGHVHLRERRNVVVRWQTVYLDMAFSSILSNGFSFIFPYL